MIIKRKIVKQPEAPREEIKEVQQPAEELYIEPMPSVEPVFDDSDFELPTQKEEDILPAEETNIEIEQPPVVEKKEEPEEIDLFNLDNIDFKQRQERRRGDRRRGFRRGDDRNLISRAREEADSIREAAQKEGYEAGLNQSAEDIQQIKESLKEFLKAPQEVFEYIAPDILEISLEIAQKIIKNEVTQNPQVVIDQITDILKTLSKEEPKVTIRVNPMQVNITKQAVPEILENAGLDAKISILPDESVGEGGCIVSTNNGVIDATIDSQIAVIKEALKEV